MHDSDGRSKRTRARPVDVRFRAWRSFLRSYKRVVSGVERRLEASSALPFTWYDVLFQLAGAPGRRLRMHELAEAVILSRSGLTRLVDRIEAAGLVTRQSIPGDRRGTHVVLTEAGRQRLASAVPVVEEAIREHFAVHLDEDDAASLVRIFSRMLAEPPDAPHP